MTEEIAMFSKAAIDKLSKTDLSYAILKLAAKVGYFAPDEDGTEKTYLKAEFDEKVVGLAASTVNTDGSKAKLIAILELLDAKKKSQETEILTMVERIEVALSINDHDFDKMAEKVERISGSKSFKLRIDKNIPKFSGSSNECLDDWLFMIDNFEKYNNPSAEDMMGLVMPLLRGHALQMAKRSSSREPNLLWIDFKSELIDTFHTDTRERKLRRELKDLKHKNNFEEFLLKFREISSQLTEMGDEELLHIFMDSIKPKVRYELVKSRVDNLEEAMRVSRIFEEHYGDLRQDNTRSDEFKKVNFVKSSFPKKFKYKNSNSLKAAGNSQEINLKMARLEKIKQLHASNVKNLVTSLRTAEFELNQIFIK